jgi:hypothetical protein
MAVEILIPLEGVSVTGLQGKELMGLTVNSINELTDSDTATFEKYYEEIYVRAYRALEVDVQKVLSGFYQLPEGLVMNGKFNINKKVGTLRTSQLINQPQDVVGEAGVNVYWSPSLYSVMNVSHVYLTVLAIIDATVDILIIDNTTGLEISKTTFTPVLGANRIPVFTNVESYNFSVLIDLSTVSILQTEQLFFMGGSWINGLNGIGGCKCNYMGGELSSTQINNGGLIVDISGTCSIAKFINININIFKLSLYYSIGREFMKDRVTSDRVNQYTVLTVDRATQLLEAYEKDYINSLQSLRDINNVDEDQVCFCKKRAVYTTNLLP